MWWRSMSTFLPHVKHTYSLRALRCGGAKFPLANPTLPAKPSVFLECFQWLWQRSPRVRKQLVDKIARGLCMGKTYRRIEAQSLQFHTSDSCPRQFDVPPSSIRIGDRFAPVQLLQPSPVMRVKFASILATPNETNKRAHFDAW